MYLQTRDQKNRFMKKGKPIILCHIDRTPQEDARLFQELNKHSEPLRHAAKELALFIRKIESPMPEMITLADILERLGRSDIQSFDDLIFDLNVQFQTVGEKVAKQHIVGKHWNNKKKHEYVEKTEIFLKKIIEFVDVSLKLNEKDQK